MDTILNNSKKKTHTNLLDDIKEMNLEVDQIEKVMELDQWAMIQEILSIVTTLRIEDNLRLKGTIQVIMKMWIWKI